MAVAGRGAHPSIQGNLMRSCHPSPADSKRGKFKRDTRRRDGDMYRPLTVRYIMYEAPGGSVSKITAPEDAGTVKENSVRPRETKGRVESSLTRRP